jgi:hypothetical protein
MVHTFNPSTWEAEAGELRVQDQPELHSNTMSQKEKSKDLEIGTGDVYQWQ